MPQTPSAVSKRANAVARPARRPDDSVTVLSSTIRQNLLMQPAACFPVLARNRRSASNRAGPAMLRNEGKLSVGDRSGHLWRLALMTTIGHSDIGIGRGMMNRRPSAVTRHTPTAQQPNASRSSPRSSSTPTSAARPDSERPRRPSSLPLPSRRPRADSQRGSPEIPHDPSRPDAA